MQKIRVHIVFPLLLIVYHIVPMNESAMPESIEQTQVQKVETTQPTAIPRLQESKSFQLLPQKINNPTEAETIYTRYQAKQDSCTLNEPANLELAKRKVKKYYEHDYIKNVICVAEQIKRHIESYPSLPGNGAVVFDIDDTVISSFDYAISTNFGYTTATYHEWELHPKRPIQPILDLYTFIINKGIKVFFITGRNELRRQATEDNLRTAGYTRWEKLYLRPQNDDAISVTPYKTNMRSDIELQGYRIIANIGDQESDLVGGFADKTFKMPNPMYTLY